jgi:hypothetical protein
LDSIVFRDPESTDEYIRRFGNTDNLIQAADAAWLLDNWLTPPDLNSLLRNDGISMWHPENIQIDFDFTDPYLSVSGGSGFGHENTDSEKVMSILKPLLDKDISTNVLLVALSQHDEHVLLPVAEKLELPLIKVANNSFVGASIIGNSELYLGGRWHGTIFALLNRTHIVNFKANTFKMRSLKKMVNHGYPIYSPNELEEAAEEIIDLIANLLVGTAEFRVEDLDLHSLRRKAKKNVDGINEAISDE